MRLLARLSNAGGWSFEWEAPASVAEIILFAPHCCSARAGLVVPLAPGAGADARSALEGAVEAGQLFVTTFKSDRDDAASGGLQQSFCIFDSQAGQIVGP